MELTQLFIFYVNDNLDSICEDVISAMKNETYLATQVNNLELRTIVANSLDEAWNIANA